MLFIGSTAVKISTGKVWLSSVGYENGRELRENVARGF